MLTSKGRELGAIATAAHLVEHAHDWQQSLKLIHEETGDEIFLKENERVILLDRKNDSASIIINSKFLKQFPKDTLPLLSPKKHKKVGVDVAWVGYPSVANAHLCFFKGSVSTFLLGDHCYLIDGVAINGVSGGPVFAAKGNKPEIIGTVSAYMPNRIDGSVLPGLLRAQDVTSFHDTVSQLHTLDEAREKEKEVSKSEAKSGEDPNLTPKTG